MNIVVLPQAANEFERQRITKTNSLVSGRDSATRWIATFAGLPDMPKSRGYVLLVTGGSI